MSRKSNFIGSANDVFKPFIRGENEINILSEASSIMTSFVGAEYIIAAMLIQKIKLGQNTLSFDELSRYGMSLQKKANTRNIDVIFLTAKDQINNAIHNYLDYFNCSYDAYNQVKNIMLDNSKDISDLEYHFIVYLPETILGLLICNQEEWKDNE